MTTTWGIDISNWNGPVTAQNLTDWTAAGVQVCMIRGSEESAALTETAIQQFTAVRPVIQYNFPYLWTYANDIPEQAVDTCLNDFGSLVTQKRLVFDVEDLVNFISHFGQSGTQLPKRYQATMAAMLGTNKVGFSSVPPAQAITWLQAAFAETVKQGFEPCIYSASWCWNPLTGSYTGFSGMKWLVAQFDNTADLTVFNSVGGVQALMGKQYSDQGRIPLTDPTAPQYDFSIYDLAAVSSMPVVSAPTIDVPTLEGWMANAYQRVKKAREDLAPLVQYIPEVANADQELDNAEQNLRYPGGPS
jgi:hypothetical protein